MSKHEAATEGHSSSTRERLLSAALDQLVELGYRGATSRKIAQVAGVNEITLFRYFSTKDELLIAALAEKTKTDSIRVPTPTGVLEDDLLYLAEELTRTFSEERALIFRLIPELSRLPEAMQSILKQNSNTIFALTTSLFRYYQERGELENESGDLLGTLFTGPIFAHYSFIELSNRTAMFDNHLHVRLFLNGHRVQS